MKTIKLAILSALALSAALGVARADTFETSMRNMPTVGLSASLLTHVDCMERDGGPSGCSGPQGEIRGYDLSPYRR